MAGVDVRAEGVVVVDDSNLAAYEAWDGADGDFWTEYEELFDAAVAEYDEAFFAAAAIRPGEQVLDIGCGTGKTTRIAARHCEPGSALGVDLSARMLERARSRAAEQNIANARFLQADAQIASFGQQPYDAAISRTGGMFFGEPVKAYANIARALRRGGRLVLLVWQPLPANEWISEFLAAIRSVRAVPAPPPEAPGPFSMAEPQRVRRILEAAGFDRIQSEAVERPMYFGRDVDDAYQFVRSLGLIAFLLSDVADESRRIAEERLRAGIARHDTGHGVWYPSASWLITARTSR